MVLCIILQQILQGTESGVYICTATLTSRTRSKYIFKTPPGDSIITTMEQYERRREWQEERAVSITVAIFSQCKQAPCYLTVDHIRLNLQS